jgi:hypothetical protein
VRDDVCLAFWILVGVTINVVLLWRALAAFVWTHGMQPIFLSSRMSCSSLNLCNASIWKSTAISSALWGSGFVGQGSS